ncbi:MAG: hypothetical protein HQ596_07075 [Candidatus Saganbacteria bacterium]|nr:hypothetical protein [Candidatus Saganbacteria bacterium]
MLSYVKLLWALVAPKLRIDCNYSQKTKYALSEFVDLTLRAEQQVNRSPYYRITDIAGNVEINL